MSLGHTGVTSEPAGEVADEASTAALFDLEESEKDCGIRDVLDRLGDKWSVQVVVELSRGVRRFRELQRALPGGISQRMLTLTVRRLERDGMVSRTVHPTVPPRVDYELTDLGRSLAHLVRTLTDWSLRHHHAIAEHRARWDAAQPQ
ncbi:helix-turn-helix domain-containing protein [Kitasatospora sp. NPDC097643]|uniref:winged helix-turn-helix transcriptional regulator n=1 Tax=Kitasatospora sp. NPDC097643 TaxID=3157230 RepID=UPI0033312304